MKSWVGDYVKAAVSLKALGVRTIDSGDKFIQIDVQELGARLRANGSLAEMMAYVEVTPEFTVVSTWESSPTAIQTLIDMRAEKNA
ncbi:hypothetical protein [Leuconostoc lactis]|uniref:hypothetical protein n=1 Tax=Leuconostoc lactis TaxID=1246 RepID=UPI00289A06C1|nr:hypothetical protein [Leuconostoc lactis]